MFYQPQNGHGLPHNPFNALIVPRPIGWISTRDSSGRDNLAPYSFFNGVAYSPPQVMFATTSAKSDRDGTEVTGIYIDDDCLTDGKLDITKYKPLSRLGYRDYAVIDQGFTLTRPDD